jgi:hypothetical protein
LPLVVYDLPERDCAALASNGELSLANNGSALYQDYINSIAAQIKSFPDVTFLLVIEPDSLANLVTNTNVQKCANAATAYKTLTEYAIKTLNMKNVIMYLDAGHAGWLGWTANIEPAAKLFGDLYKAAGSPAAVRGLVTNVANYNAWSIATCPSYTQGNTNCDEKRYVNALAPLLKQYGFPAHFITDTGTSIFLISSTESCTDISQAATAFNPPSNWRGVTGATSLAPALAFDQALPLMTHCSTPTFGLSPAVRAMVLLTLPQSGTMLTAVLRMLSSLRPKRELGSRRTLCSCCRTPARHFSVWLSRVKRAQEA